MLQPSLRICHFTHFDICSCSSSEEIQEKVDDDSCENNGNRLVLYFMAINVYPDVNNNCIHMIIIVHDNFLATGH